ncbi:secreted RxLR effector protein 161-like [Alnus glutinosa]|uniref:secreted RxLR effector protein 161-like n=1 Tax=Alnus glutinosa TaxID=3517 RepID=UPI002D76732D|nr:secreted RxLR effector protein 161-like [Alnus glutinosa]
MSSLPLSLVTLPLNLASSDLTFISGFHEDDWVVNVEHYSDRERFQSSPRLAHSKTVKRMLRYIKGTVDYILCYQGLDLRLVGYSDVDWGSNIDERKLTSGYAFLLIGTITWICKIQICIALSTMEVKYVACSTAVQEAIWLRRFLQHLEIIVDALDPVTIHRDSTAALAYAKDPKYHGRTRHIYIRYHYI